MKIQCQSQWVNGWQAGVVIIVRIQWMLIENIGFITLKIQMMLKAAMQVRKFERRYKKADKNLARVKNTELKKKQKQKTYYL